MREKSRSSGGKRFPIGTIVSVTVLLVLAVMWSALVIWLGTEAGDHWLPIISMIAVGGGAIASGFFLFHGLYVMYCLLPAIDEHLDPHLARYTRHHGDPMFWRSHRLLLYSGSLAWDWAHRRMMYRDYDFQSLPLTLRLPLLLNFYSLWGGLSAGLVGGALMKLSQELGLM